MKNKTDVILHLFRNKKVYPQPNNTPEKMVTFTSFDFVNLTFYT